jgi:peptidoglycan hydrolase CwlO-like protein
MIRKQFVITFFLFILVFSFGAPKSSLSFDCVVDLNNSSSADQKQFCQNELNQLLSQVAAFEKQLSEQIKQTGTIKGDVAYLTSQINGLKTKIKSRSLVIATLKVSINEKSSKIKTLSEKIESEKQSLAQLIRKTNEADNENFVHLIFSDGTLFDFYSDIESYSSIKEAIKKSVDSINGIKKETEAQKADLEKKQDAETDAKIELENAQKKVAQSEAEKKKLLSISQNKEAEYKKLAAEKKAKADRIRAALFPLAGTSQKIEFGTALKYSNEAKDLLGIDPAFLLAIFRQESNLGSNVGQCYMTNPETGGGIGVNTGTAQIRVMRPDRDVGPFLAITNRLGIDYKTTRVSCWIRDYRNGSPFGWGGAMGPAQFIPSTWKLFENRLRTLLGYEANPWAAHDAFMASAMYLTDLGAVGTSTAAQHRAACKYYGSGGATCAYSNSVMKFKKEFQADIDLLSY